MNRTEQRAIQLRAVEMMDAGVSAVDVAVALSKTVAWVHWANKTADGRSVCRRYALDLIVDALDLLRNGRTFASVARKTKMSVKDVRALDLLARAVGIVG